MAHKAKEVEDRGSQIRVTGLHAIPIGRKAYVKVETNMGVTGWGEINNMETNIACALAESLGQLIIGENPTRIEHHWQRLFRAHRNLRGGGISQMKKIATLAEAHHVPLAPHCTMSYLGLTASLHVAASIPFFLIHEGYQNVLPDGVAHKTWTMDDEGYVSLPEGPGLGVEIDEQKAIEVGSEPSNQFRWPDNRLKDGSIADY